MSLCVGTTGSLRSGSLTGKVAGRVRRARKGELRKFIAAEETDLGGIITGLHDATDHLGLERQEERHAVTGLTRIGIDHLSDDHLQTGLLQRLTPGGGSRILAGIDKSRWQRPLPSGGFDASPDQQQPTPLVMNDDADTDLRVSKVQPPTHVAALRGARRHALGESTTTGRAEAGGVGAVVRHHGLRTATPGATATIEAAVMDSPCHSREISALYRPWNELPEQRLLDAGHVALPEWISH
jgi:hypothetical protein